MLRYWVIAWAVWNGVMFHKNSQHFQIIILFIRSISKPVLQTDVGTKSSATWLSSGSWTCQHLSCELPWLSRCVLLARSKREVMQPVGILQLRLLLCSKGRLTQTVPSSTVHLTQLPTPAGQSAASESSCLQIDLEWITSAATYSSLLTTGGEWWLM